MVSFKPMTPVALVVIASSVLLACSSSEPPPPVEPEAATEAAAEASAEPPAPVANSRVDTLTHLVRAPGRTFGAPLPAGLDLVERDDDVATFVTEHTLDQLLSFYRNELTRHDYNTRERGAEFLSAASGEPDIFIVDRTIDREVVYFRTGLEEEAAAAIGDIRQQLDPDQIAEREFEQRYPWPQGPIDRSRTGTVQEDDGVVDSGLYEERFEEINGEQVRVLVPTYGPNATPPPVVTREYPSGYVREDGTRSMRPVPETDRRGNPLPYAGSVRVNVPPDSPQ